MRLFGRIHPFSPGRTALRRRIPARRALTLWLQILPFLSRRRRSGHDAIRLYETCGFRLNAQLLRLDP